jgi:hypothetical protein
MADVVEFSKGGRTYRVMGLQAKARSIGSAASALDEAVEQRLAAAKKALVAWEGAHAATFAEDVNDVLAQMVTLHQTVSRAGRVAAAFPDPPGAVPGANWTLDDPYASARVEVPSNDGTAAALVADLRQYTSVASGQDGTFATRAGAVNLEDVTAQVSYERALNPAERQLLLDDGRSQQEVDAETTTQTDTVTDLSTLVTLPDARPLVAPLRAASQRVGEFVSAVALAFEKDHRGLLGVLAGHPELAAGVIDVLLDRRVDTAQGALAVLQDEWDVFDNAGEGGDTDGIVSHKDIRAIMEHPERFPPGDAPDTKVSREDLDLFIDLSDHVRTLNENFDAFDGAAGDRNGRVTTEDLEAIAQGDGPAAEAARWLLDHDDQRERLAGYEARVAAAAGLDDIPDVDGDEISRLSVVGLAVDQQVYGDYNPANLRLPPGMIPPPPPQLYIDRGAAGEFDQDPWYSTLDDKATEEKWRTIADIAEATGNTDAARHMRHYLDGTGEDLPLDVDRVLRDEPFLRSRVDGTIAAEIDRVVQSGDYGRPIPIATDWTGHRCASENWHRAIGGVTYAVTGVVTVDPPAAPGGQPRVDVNYQVHLYDRYNWDEGDDPATPDVEPPKGVMFPEPVGFVEDRQMAELQRAGLAREYDIRGTSNTYSYQGAPPEAGPLPDPPDGRSGRDDPGRQPGD